MRKTVLIIIVGLGVWVGVCSPQATPFYGHTGEVSWALFAPDANTFASVSYSDNTIRVCDVENRCTVAVLSLEKNNRTWCVAFSPDSRMMALGGEDNVVTVWDIFDGKQLCQFRGHTSDVRALAFSPDGKTLASGSKDRTIRLWDIQTAKQVKVLQGQLDLITSVVFNPDGKKLVSSNIGSGVEITVWDIVTGKECISFGKKGGSIRHLVVSPDGKTLCSVDSRLVRLWDIITGKERHCDFPEWLMDGDSVDAVTFSPDSNTLAAGHELAIGLWDVTSGKNTTTFTQDGPRHLLRFSDRLVLDPVRQHYPSISAAAFKSNGDLLVLATLSKAVTVWPVTSVKLK